MTFIITPLHIIITPTSFSPKRYCRRTRSFVAVLPFISAGVRVISILVYGIILHATRVSRFSPALGYEEGALRRGGWSRLRYWQPDADIWRDDYDECDIA